MVTKTSVILDADGKPISYTGLSEPQTSQAGWLSREFQGHPARGLTPSRLSSILVAAEQGDVVAQYELFEDMEERDGHILSEMSKRRRAVSGLSWEIVPPSKPSKQEEAAAETLRELLCELDEIDSLFFDTTDAIGKGFACQEIEWHRVDGRWLPRSVTHRPQSWFRLYRGAHQEVRLRDNSPDGAPLRPFGWIMHTHRARSGYLERANLFRALVWPYLFKNYSVADLAEFLEIYGIPLRLGKYPPGSSDKEKTTLLRALMQIGHNAAGIVPEGMSIEFQNAAQGDPKAFQLMMDWCERTQSKVILGATLTSQADRGSNTNALGEVHNEVRKELRDSDAKQVATTLSRDLVYPIAALNGLAPEGFRRCPRLVLDIAETKDIKVFADALPPLVKLGMRIPVEWAHKELGIPQAEDDEQALAEPEPVAPVVPIGTQRPVDPAANDPAANDPDKAPERAAARARIAALAITGGGLDAAAYMAPQLDRNLTSAAQWIEQIRALTAQVQSLDELRDRLLELYPDLSLDAYAEAMALAGAVSHLAGRSEVQDQTRGNA
jgi:phage gp29-like protein